MISAARARFPHYPDELLDYILWNETAYPFASREHVCAQLDELASLYWTEGA